MRFPSAWPRRRQTGRTGSRLRYKTGVRLRCGAARRTSLRFFHRACRSRGRPSGCMRGLWCGRCFRGFPCRPDGGGGCGFCPFRRRRRVRHTSPHRYGGVRTGRCRRLISGGGCRFLRHGREPPGRRWHRSCRRCRSRRRSLHRASLRRVLCRGGIRRCSRICRRRRGSRPAGFQPRGRAVRAGRRCAENGFCIVMFSLF